MNNITHTADTPYNAPTATRYAHLTGEFQMYRGGSLSHLSIAYETWGQLNTERSNALLIFTGLSTSAHAASSKRDTSQGWWEFMVARQTHKHQQLFCYLHELTGQLLR